MPALLSEHDALHLLRTHCSVLRRRLVFDTLRTDGAVMKQDWMSLLCVMVTDGELASGLGYELRVAIDVVNALCSCWGFSPDRNHRFWRTAVSELWIEYSEDKYDPRRRRYKEYLFQPPPHVMLPFDRAAFSCFAIDFQEYPVSGFESTLAELWRQVTWTDAASKCPDWILHRQRLVMEQLVGSGLVVRPIRVLHLELIVPTNATALPGHSVDPPELLEPEWPVLINAISEIERETCARPAKGPLRQLLLGSATSTSVPTSKHELSIAFHPDYRHGVYLHSSNLEAMQQLLCGCRSVKCITLNVQLVREADTTDQVELFGVLLRALLVELKTLKTLRLFSGVTKRAAAPTLAAVGSVLPLAWSLESLSLSCFHGGMTIRRISGVGWSTDFRIRCDGMRVSPS
jgi:hypothetical protein